MRDRVQTDGSDIRYDDSQNFVIENGVLTAYNGWQKHVVIPDGVVTIGESAFYNAEHRSSIYTVTMPNSVTKIEKEAFYDLGNLAVVRFSQNLQNIGIRAFAYCTNLANVYLPGSMKEIKEYAFRDCSRLGYVSLGSTTTLGYCAFKNCTSLKAIKIPASVTSVSDGQSGDYYGYGAFYGCTNLNSVVFETGTTVVAEEILGGCAGIKEIVVPDGTTEIRKRAFYGCSNLIKIIIPASVDLIQEKAFGNSASVTIHGWRGSYAETYAKENNIPFVSLGCLTNPSQPTDRDVIWTTQLDSGLCATDDTILVDATLENRTAQQQSGQALLAFYNENGKLLGTATQPFTLDAAETKTCHFRLKTTGSPATLAVFLLDPNNRPLSTAFKTAIRK